MKLKCVKAITILLILSMLIGCGRQEVVYVDGNNDKAQISFSWWGNDNRHAYTMDGVDLFNRQKLNIAVSYRYGEWAGYERKNNIWVESNSQADVMQINYAWLNTYSPDGNGYYDLYQLSDYIDFSGYDENDLAFGEIDGKLNAIPIAYNTSTICFNKKILDDYDLEIPKTWEDLFEAADILSEQDICVLGAVHKHVMLLLYSYYEQTQGKVIFDKEGRLTVDHDGIGYLLDFYKRMLDEKVLLPIDQFERAQFANGKCAGSLFWISDADNYCGALKDNGGNPVFSTYPMAETAKMSGLYIKPATMYSISSITEYPAESAELLNYLINDKYMIELQGTEKGVPANKNAVKILEKEGLVEGFGFDAYNQMQNDKDKMNNIVPAMENEGVIDAFMMNADAYMYGVKSREEVINSIYDEMHEALK